MNSPLNDKTVLDNRSAQGLAVHHRAGGGTLCWWGKTQRLHPAVLN